MRLVDLLSGNLGRAEMPIGTTEIRLNYLLYRRLAPLFFRYISKKQSPAKSPVGFKLFFQSCYNKSCSFAAP